MTKQTARLQSVTQITPEVKQFQFQLQSNEWDYQPGQHTTLHASKESGEVERPYTMINLPEERQFALAIKLYTDGEATPWIHDRQPGDKIMFDEPAGNLKIADYDQDVVFVSTGTGATPLFCMLRDYLQNGTGKAYYFHGEKRQETILFKEQLELLEAENDNLEVIFSLTDESWLGKEGYIQEHISDQFESLNDKHFYVCGVPQMVVQTKELLSQEGVKEDFIFTEGWEHDAVEE